MRFFTLLVCLAASSSSFAAKQFNDLTIKELSMGWGGEGVFVRVNENIEVAETCNAAVFQMNKEYPLFSENYSMLLSAFHSGSTVGLFVDGCVGNNMKLKAVRIKK